MATVTTELKELRREIERLKKRLERLETAHKRNGKSKTLKSRRVRIKRKPRANARTNGGERRVTGFEQLFGSIDLGTPIDLNNEAIDRDLAREYADTHEPKHAD